VADVDAIASERAKSLEAEILAKEAEIQRAREDIAALALRVQELEEVLDERMSELADKDTQVRHLLLDATVKEEYVVQLRSELVAAEQREAAEPEARRAEVDHLRAELARYDHFRFRLAERSNTLLWKVPAVHRVVKGTLRGAMRVRGRLRRR
jgi:chromosome segregation ATPase